MEYNLLISYASICCCIRMVRLQADQTGAGGGRILQKRFCQLMIPYFIWSLIQFFKWGILTWDVFLKIFIQPDAYFWFLWCLFFICVIFMGAQKIADILKINEGYTIIGSCSVLLLIMVLLNFRMFGFQFIAYYFIFYSLGYFIHKCDLPTYSNSIITIILILLWCVLAWYWKMKDLPTWVPNIHYIPSALLQYMYRGVTAAVAIFILLTISPRFLNISTTVVNVLSHFGIVSLGVYTFHLLVLKNVLHFLQNILPSSSDELLVILITIILVPISWGVTSILQKNKVTAKLFLGKF